eukprot:g20763.t1
MAMPLLLPTIPVAASTSTAAAGAGVAYRPPDMLQPQRIELPGYLNTPARPAGQSFFERNASLRKMKDLELLTFACRRASKFREEGRAHFSLGVLRDNLCQYQKAIEAYTQFLRVCKECNDSQGAALGYHCIAVDYQLQGSGQSKKGDTEEEATGQTTSKGALDMLGPPPSARTTRPELLRKAIYYHNRHREIADSIGKFVAHLNMGLAYAQLGEREASTVNHQYALRYALQLHSLEGQSLAIGSLSFSAGMYDHEPDKMKILVESYAEKDCAVRLGIAAGQAKMAEHLSTILQRSVIGFHPRAHQVGSVPKHAGVWRWEMHIIGSMVGFWVRRSFSEVQAPSMVALRDKVAAGVSSTPNTAQAPGMKRRPETEC